MFPWYFHAIFSYSTSVANAKVSLRIHTTASNSTLGQGKQMDGEKSAFQKLYSLHTKESANLRVDILVYVSWLVQEECEQ